MLVWREEARSCQVEEGARQQKHRGLYHQGEEEGTQLQEYQSRDLEWSGAEVELEEGLGCRRYEG